VKTNKKIEGGGQLKVQIRTLIMEVTYEPLDWLVGNLFCDAFK
jgi:hypothetical protein